MVRNLMNNKEAQAGEPQHFITETEEVSATYAHDALYASGTVEEGSFVFDERVARVFTNMAQRSIPGYFDIQNFTAYYAAQYLHDAPSAHEGHSDAALRGVLDIGASLGTTVISITRYAHAQNMSLGHCSVIACDNSPEMLTRAEANVHESEQHWHDVAYECVDIADATQRTALLSTYEINDVSLTVVILHFVLQFTPMELRADILRDVWNAIGEKGVLVIGEKLRANDETSEHVWDAMYRGFKKGMGYSDKEIEGKCRALTGVLCPMQHKDFMALLTTLPHSTIDAFFTWGPFHAYAVHKG